MIRWAYAASFLVSVLLLVLMGLVGEDGLEQPIGIALSLLGWVWPLVCLGLAIAAIVDAIVRAVRGDVRALAQGALVVKLAAVPFFVVNLLMTTFATLVMSIIPGGALLGIVFVPLTWAIMLPTSAYGIAALIRLKVDRDVGWTPLLLLVPMHLALVLDVVASIVAAILVRGARGPRHEAPPTADEVQAWARMQQHPPQHPPTLQPRPVQASPHVPPQPPQPTA